MTLAGAGLALRSMFWTFVMPGVVAGLVPWRFFGLGSARFNDADPLHWVGAICLVSGATLLLTCIWEFAHTGRGTLSPADPPRVLVVRGLYRYVRNPMYLSVALVLLGEALLLRSTDLALYGGAFVVAASLFVVLYEEPALTRQFGDAYTRYLRETGRWIPRIGKP